MTVQELIFKLQEMSNDPLVGNFHITNADGDVFEYVELGNHSVSFYTYDDNDA